MVREDIFPPKPGLGDSKSVFRKHYFLSLLNLCSSIKQLSQIHAQIGLYGLQHDIHLINKLVQLCSISHTKNLDYARSIVYYSISLTPCSWNFLIRGYAKSNAPREAIWVFCRMRMRGIRPNSLTFPFILKACASNLAFGEGKQVHGDVYKRGLDCDVFVNNNLVHFYGSCKKIFHASKLFDEMPGRNVVSWNVMITSCVECSWLTSAIGYFKKMIKCGVKPDHTTMVLMLFVCAETGNLSFGRSIHSQILGRGMELTHQLGTALVHMYANSGSVTYARLVFNKMKDTNVWIWSAMILGLAQHGYAQESLELFQEMLKIPSLSPNHVTFLGVLCACSHAGLVDDGFRYLCEMEQNHGIKPTMAHYGSMVDILGRSGRLKEAYKFISSLPIRPNSIVWRTLLCACSIHNAKNNDGVAIEVKRRLLELEPRRCGNLIIVANMYANSGMWEKVARIRKQVRDGGLKKVSGESCIEFGGCVHRFFSGLHSQCNCETLYELLEELNSLMKMSHLL